MMTVSRQFLSISAHFLLSTPIFLDESESSMMLGATSDEFDEGPQRQVHDGHSAFHDHPSAISSHNPLECSAKNRLRRNFSHYDRRRQNVNLTQKDLCVLLRYTSRELNTIRIGRVFMKQTREEDMVRSDVLLSCVRQSAERSMHLSALHLNCTGLAISDLVSTLSRIAPRLQTLDLSDLELNYAHELIAIVGNCTPQILKNLTLDNCYRFEELAEMENRNQPHLYQRFLTVLYTLTSLCLKRCGRELLMHKKKSGRQTIIFDFCPFLEHLSIGDQNMLIDWNGDLKKTIDERGKNLRSLHVKGGRITLTCNLYNDDVSSRIVDLFPKLTSVVMDTNIGFFKTYLENNEHVSNFMGDTDVVNLLRRIRNLHITGVPNHQQTIPTEVFEWALEHVVHTERLSIMDFSQLRDQCVSNNISSLKNIRSLDLSTTSASDELIVLVVNNLPQLTNISACYAKNKPLSPFREEVNLGGFLLSYTDAVNLGLVLKKRGKCKLSYINFSNSKISCYLIAFLLTAASSTLENLLLKGSIGYDYVDHESGVDITESLKELTRINLAESNSSLCSFVVEQLGLRTCPNLLSINISRIKSDGICDMSNIHLESLLSSSPKLSSIKAENLTQMTDAIMEIAGNKCHRLTKLELSGTSISLNSLLELQQLSQLTILKATGIEMPTNLDDVHTLIQHLNSVRILALNLHDCGLSNRTLEYLALNCACIETLILGGRPLQHMGQFITKRGFISFIVGSTSLQMLIMDFCPIAELAVVKQLQQTIRGTGRSAPTLILPYVRNKTNPKKGEGCKNM